MVFSFHAIGNAFFILPEPSIWGLLMVGVAVIGASSDRSKFSNKAVRAYLSEGFEVYPVNPREQLIEGLVCYRSVGEIEKEIDVALFYVTPGIGMQLVDGVAQKGVKSIYLNPGADSDELEAKAKSLGIEVLRECAIRALGIVPDEI